MLACLSWTFSEDGSEPTHHIEGLVDPVGAALRRLEPKLELLQTPVRHARTEAVRPGGRRGANLGHEVAHRPESLHDDAGAVREVGIADGAAQQRAADLLGEPVRVARVDAVGRRG